MPDKLMRVQVTIPLDSALPEDAVVNTLYFDGDEDLDGIATDDDYHQTAFGAVRDFYQAIDLLCLAGSVGSEATVKIYDMRDAKPRVPEFTDTFTLTPDATNPLPNEVAVCLSFAAAGGSGLNPRRRRGRIYLGPWPSSSSSTEVVSGQSRPTAAARTAIANAAASMKQTDLPIGIGGSVRWAVYSPTTDLTSSIDDAFNDVETGWVDNAFDTQRRRGPDATARTTFS